MLTLQLPRDFRATFLDALSLIFWSLEQAENGVITDLSMFTDPATKMDQTCVYPEHEI